MTYRSNPRVILITGTSKGIGYHLATHYLALGDFVIGCSRSESTISNKNYKHHSVDISNGKSIHSMFADIRRNKKKLDVLVNNAAVNPEISFSVLINSDSIARAFETNIIAVMKICQEAVKLMSRKKKGRIINISSMAAKLEMPGESVYTSTKAALNAYTMVLAKEVNALGITVNGVAPSAIRTDLSAQIDQKALMKVLSRNAVPYFGEMEDVSILLIFLLNNEVVQLTGKSTYLGVFYVPESNIPHTGKMERKHLYHSLEKGIADS